MAGAGHVLRQELAGHGEDVRSAARLPDSALVTVSRDKTGIVWRAPVLPDGSGEYEPERSLLGHEHYVTCVAYLPAGAAKAFPEGAIVTGSRDATIKLWDSANAGDQSAPSATLRGHTQQVSDVAACGASGRIASACLDSTARVWDLGAASAPEAVEAAVLSAHSGPVLCTCFTAAGELLTGSGDTTVLRWGFSTGGASVAHTYRGHTDSVRGLCELPGTGFASASHDMTIALWAIDGALLRTLVGHSALVYGVASLPNGLLASGSEDDTMRVWSVASAECVQSIEHTGCVWGVTALENGDVVSCCADGVARVWTTDEVRAAATDVREAFEAKVAKRRKEIADAKSGGGGDQQASAAGGGAAGMPPMRDASVLNQPGKKDGEVAVVAEGGKGVAYVYSAAQGGWEKIGVVVNGPGEGGQEISGQGNVLNGVQYDHVFDVDIADGAPVRKLPYNIGQNPYDVAESWLEEHDLPAGYREQVVKFLIDSTGGKAAEAINENLTVYDPFTGGGAYVPAAGGAAAGGGAQLGGLASVDPYTGSGAYGGPSPSDPPQGTYVPLSAPVHAFPQPLKVEPLLTKLDTFNAELAADPLTAEFALSVDERAAFEANARALPGGVVVDAGASLTKVLSGWPVANLFPALDVARCAAANPAGAASQGLLQASAADAITAAVRRAASGGGAASLLAARFTCELFVAAPTWLESRAGALVNALIGGAPAAQAPNARMARAAALLNACALLKARNSIYGGGDFAGTLARAIADVLVSEDDNEALFRLVAAAGTLAAARVPAASSALAEIKPRLQALTSGGGGKVADAAREACAWL